MASVLVSLVVELNVEIQQLGIAVDADWYLFNFHGAFIMNEQIKELSLQASNSIPDDVSAEHAMYLFQKKFAELIIKECARVARATPAPNFHEHLKQQLGHTWDMACAESGNYIEKHFGVEK